MLNFGLIGAAGYVAPRHMEAIKETGNDLVVALDPNDSVGILDSYFPNCKFFTQVERFDRHIMREENLHYMSICSPNYLHESHCKLGLRLGANVICEKPLVLCERNIDQLRDVEEKMDKKIYSILQLRLHPTIKMLKEQVDPNKHHNVELTYITPRGHWYLQSWKGMIRRSGGIETNIGIHFFDMLLWIFGKCDSFIVTEQTNMVSTGILYLKSAQIYWKLSLKREDLPDPNLKYYRSIKIDGEEIRFDDIFSDLHTESYMQILNGNGFGIDETYEAIKLVSDIREARSI